MAQFDVHPLRRDGGLVIDCQSELLSNLTTRFVVPLTARQSGPEPAKRLNPIFKVGEQEYVMRTQFAATVPKRELGEAIVSLNARSFEIVGALDVLISGV